MFRRISTKWVVTALAAVVLPFLGFAWYVDKEVAKWNATDVQYDLLSIAGGLADRLDNEIRQYRLDVEIWGRAPLADWAIENHDGSEVKFHPTLENGFDEFVRARGHFDLILAVDREGQLVVSNAQDAQGVEFSRDSIERRMVYPYERTEWFQKAMLGETAMVDHHRSDLLPPRNPSPGVHPENFHIGFAVPVRSQSEPEKVVGVIFGLVNWSHVQTGLLLPVRPNIPDLASADLYRSSYAWLWMADADTIIAHRDTDLYTMRVSEPPIELPQMVAAAREKDWGMYPPYEFRGLSKRGAFKHCAGPKDGGFGWIVGVGVDDRDIFAMVHRPPRPAHRGDALRALGRRGRDGRGRAADDACRSGSSRSRPSASRQGTSNRASTSRSKDELGDLASSFNHMTRELAESRRRLVRAEKDAAWKEMARQVAHEIKNPLTPINLSVDLLKRPRDEKSPQFDAIFDRTVDLVQRQVEGMRRIASDFSAFAGTHKSDPSTFDPAAVPRRGPRPERRLGGRAGVRVERSFEETRVHVDRGELRRVLINLVSNALEAMTGGGELCAGSGDFPSARRWRSPCSTRASGSRTR